MKEVHAWNSLLLKKYFSKNTIRVIIPMRIQYDEGIIRHHFMGIVFDIPIHNPTSQSRHKDHLWMESAGAKEFVESDSIIDKSNTQDGSVVDEGIQQSLLRVTSDL